MTQIAKTLLISSLILSSCRTLVDIPQEDARHDLTVIFAGSTAEGLAPQTLRISRTDFGQFKLKNDAEVSLTASGQSIPVLPATGERSKGRYTFSYAFRPGEEIALRVSEGGSIVTARTTVPQEPQLLGFDVEEVREGDLESSYTHTYLRWRVRIQDRVGENNFYRITATQECLFEDVDSSEEIALSTTEPVVFDGKADPIISEGRPQTNAGSGFDIEEALGGRSFTNIYTVFSDILFRDKEVEVKLKSDVRSYHSFVPYISHIGVPEGANYFRHEVDGVLRKLRYKYHRYTLRLHATSEDMYEYLRALGRFEANSEGSPFITPVRLHSNISGGAGIFAVNAVREQTIVKRHD